MISFLILFIKNNKYVLNDIISKIGPDELNNMIQQNSRLSRPRLKRETSDQIYMQQLMVGSKDELDKQWFESRLDRANQRQLVINTPKFIRFGGTGFLLDDMIKSDVSIQEIFLFRIKNAYNKYLNIIYKELYLINNLPSICIREIISYINYTRILSRDVYRNSI